MQKAKKEDFRVEEELRSQKVKYEEATEEVLRRMMDIKESEPECTADMSAFLDAQLNYHEKCREVLLQLKDEWPAGYVSTSFFSCTILFFTVLTNYTRPTQQFNSYGRRSTLTRSNTSFNDQMAGEDTYQSSFQQPGTSRSREPSRPGLGGRQPTFEGPTQLRTRRPSPSPAPALRTPLRTASDSISPATIGSSAAGIANARSQLRVISQGYNGGNNNNNNSNTHNDGYYDSTTDDGASPVRNSPDQYYSSTSTSPLRTVPASGQVPTPASGSGSGTATPVKKPPPPPPPSRSKKPPPPPPPPKRSVSAYAV